MNQQKKIQQMSPKLASQSVALHLFRFSIFLDIHISGQIYEHFDRFAIIVA